ncbi:MAG: FtsH protease activity modulator HflK [Nitrospinota bacterium]|nr:FtsH protease activity modulator HflK [Nitrospinota bacterium]
MSWDDKDKPPRRGGAGGFDKIPDIPDFDLSKLKPPSLRSIHFVFMGMALFLLYMATGIYSVQLQERAVVLAFGKHVDTTPPGMHWNIPYPLGKVVKVRMEEIKKVEVGLRTGPTGLSHADLLKEAQMLTEGINMIDVQMSVQYQIKDPAQFLFGVSDPQLDRNENPRYGSVRMISDEGLKFTVRNVAEAALREVVGSSPIDDVLTVGRSKIQQEVHELMQRILDIYGAGVTINLVQLQDVFPPEAVKESFHDVNNAEEDMNRLIRDAEGYSNAIIPQTRGKAAQIVAEAEAYSAQKVNMAKGDALRFDSQLTEYIKAPEITKKRLYLETMEIILGKVDKTIIDSESLSSLVPLLSLGQSRGSKRQALPKTTQPSEQESGR